LLSESAQGVEGRLPGLGVTRVSQSENVGDASGSLAKRLKRSIRTGSADGEPQSAIHDLQAHVQSFCSEPWIFHKGFNFVRREL
jgi:hypothetical protein